MKAAEIREMTTAELEAKLLQLKKDLFFLRMQHATNQLDNPMQDVYKRQGAVSAADAADAADDNGLDHIALFNSAARLCLTDRSNNDIANVAELPLGAAQHTDALDFLGAGIVGNLQIAFLLNHI